MSKEKFLVFLQFLCGCGCVASFVVLFWGNNGPLSPDPVRGLIVPQNVHGQMHYISQTMKHRVDIAQWTFPLCIFVAAIAEGIGRFIKRPSR